MSRETRGVHHVFHVMHVWYARFRIICNAKTRGITIELALCFANVSALLVLSFVTVIFVSVTRTALMQAWRSFYLQGRSRLSRLFLLWASTRSSTVAASPSSRGSDHFAVINHSFCGRKSPHLCGIVAAKPSDSKIGLWHIYKWACINIQFVSIRNTICLH